MATCFNNCYTKVKEGIGKVFSCYGRFVARHPWKIIVIGILLNGLLGIGMLKLTVVIDVGRVYTPIGSQASKDSEKVGDLFPDVSGTNFIGYQMPDFGRYGEVIVRPQNGNILDGAFLTQLINLYNFLLSINTTDENGKTVTLSHICARSFNDCSIDGDVFVDPQFITDVNSSTPIPFPYYNHSLRGQIYYEQIVGGPSISSNTLISAKMLIMRVNLRTDSDYFKNTAKKWQDSFLSKLKEYSSSYFDTFYLHSDSLSEELNENVSGDILIFSITFTMMITYACVGTMTVRCDVVGQRSNLGFAGVFAAGLAIAAAFGLGSACGVEFVSIVGVVPFLIIGIGVDDMFMLMSGMTSTNYEHDVETRIGETMKTSGVSITITSLTDLLAFAAGASSVFLSVRNFCIYCGIAVVFCYINQATIFLACIAINEHRTYDNRHFASCLKLKTPDEVDRNTSKCNMLCNTGRKPKNQSESESYLDRLPRWLIPKMITPAFTKVTILSLFAGYLGVFIWGVTQMKQGLQLQNLVAKSSYYYTYREHLDNNFPLGTPLSIVFESKMTYSDASVQANIASLLSKLKKESTVQDDLEINWLSAYKSDTINYKDSSEIDFISGLQDFLSNPMNTRFQNDVVFDIRNTSITASRIHLMSESIKQSQEQGKFMLRMREVVSESSLSVFVFSPAFLFYEQYVAILSQTLQTVGIAIAMVFFVTCIFMPHPLLPVYITATVAMIALGIFGFLPFLGLTLSAITMFHIIVSIGFSVDFAEKMTSGIIRSGAPIFHGAISSLLGVVMLAAAKSYIYTVFQVLSLVIIFGAFHLFFLTVVLSFIDPFSSQTVESQFHMEMLEQRRSTTSVHSVKHQYRIRRPSVSIEPLYGQLSPYQSQGVNAVIK